jgi:hypothetical protein
MRKINFKSTVVIIALAFLLAAFAPVSPVLADTTGDQSALPTLPAFSTSVQNSNAYQITGLFVSGLMAVPVVQQPSGQPGYVSTSTETLTQFAAASKYGTTGLLAHNYLAGSHFFNLSRGSVITLVYGDGSSQYYQVFAVMQFQALSPNSPYSQFVNLAQPDVTLSSTDLFYQTYGLGDVLVLQTCIEKGNESSWGRLFIIAKPVDMLADASYAGSTLPDTNSEFNLLFEF